MKTLARFGAILFSISCLQANDTPGGDPDLPQPLDLDFSYSMMEHSPFTRSVNLEESLQLTAIAYVNGRPVATVFDRDTQQRILVSEEPNELGWKLITAAAGADLSLTKIEMMVGPEVITMHYGGQQLSPGVGAKDGSTSRLASKGTGQKNGGKFRASSFLGENGKELYSSLSPEARSKFKELVRSHVEKQPDQTPEQSSTFAKKVFAKIKQTDHPSASGNTKAAKPSKKKQGA